MIFRTKAFPLYWQAESTDCGPACLQMICHYWGNKHGLEFIKDGIDASRIGVTVGDIVRRSKELGFEAAVAQSKPEALAKIDIPVIIHWKSIHFVVLYKVTRNKTGLVYHIADPANGRMKVPGDEFGKFFLDGKDLGTFIILTPTETFYKAEIKSGSISREYALNIFRLFLRKKYAVIAIILLTLLSSACSWILPYLYRAIIDKGVIPGNMDTLMALLGIQSCFFAGYAVSSLLSSYIMNRLGFTVSITMVRQLLDKIMRLPLKYFETHLNGEFLQRFQDLDRLRTFLTENMVEMAFSVLNLILFGSLLCYFSPIAFGVFLIFTSFSLIWNTRFLEQRKFVDYALFTHTAENRTLLYDIMSGMTDIKVNNAQQYQTSVWEYNQTAINKLQMSQAVINYKLNSGRMAISLLQSIVIIGICCLFTASDGLSLGSLMSISYIMGQLSGPVARLQDFRFQLQNASISSSRLAELERKESDQPHVKSEKRIPFSNFEFKDISFKYPGSFCPWVVKNLSFTLKAGTVTAIVGHSGSGKSTLAKLIMGLYTPQKGSVYLDGELLQRYSMSHWVHGCGAVLQNGHIFSCSVAQNIALSENPDMEEVVQVAKIACIYDSVSSMPAKFHTRIGGNGLELSQGQKQRILIARALYQDPRVLIMDEATSSLDAETEAKLMVNLKDTFKTRTVIIIAHRLSTVKNADSIIFMDNGTIVEQGTHSQLVGLHGKYYNLIHNQLELES